jgi:hypothetical protein
VVAAGSVQVTDDRIGSTHLRGLIPKGQLLGCDLERTLVQGTSGGIPDRVENELYARYYVLLEDDWGSEVDANKMPGWDARFGWWNAMGYWQATTGNGGLRPTGLKVRNATMNRWEYQGASIRGHGGTKTNDGNPYDHLFWMGNYVYHLDQATNYGEAINWTGVVIGKGRWYCIEQYIKMNTITGPYDANGNGVALKDGHLKVWVDGAVAFERTDFRWRRHPEMGIQGFWLNWYHGGTAAAPRDMHFRMDSVVIARSYIGPRNEAEAVTVDDDADQVFGWAERTYSQVFAPMGTLSLVTADYRYRPYDGGHYLAVGLIGSPHLYYVGPFSNNVVLDLGLLGDWLVQAKTVGP